MLSSTSVISSGEFGEASAGYVSDDLFSAVGASGAAANLPNPGVRIQQSLFQRLRLPHYNLVAERTRKAADFGTRLSAGMSSQDRYPGLFGDHARTMLQFMWQADLHGLAKYVTECLGVYYDTDPISGSGI